MPRLGWARAPFALLAGHRHMLAATTLNDIRARFAGSVLGLTWLIVYPLLLLSAYAAVYLYIYKVRVAAPQEYVVLIFCGLIPFLGISEALGSGVGSITANAHLVKNTLFPIDLIPVKAALSAQCTQLGGTVLLLIALAALHKLSWFALWLVPIWMCQIAFTVGLLWILSSLNIYIRDLQNIISVIIMILMMITPIAYTPDMVPAGLRPFLRLNPLYYLISAYQECLMLGRTPHAGIIIPFAVMALVAFVAGHVFLSRLKLLFADNI
jgi:lipopolysaccharide transport system permease protein